MSNMYKILEHGDESVLNVLTEATMASPVVQAREISIKIIDP